MKEYFFYKFDKADFSFNAVHGGDTKIYSSRVREVFAHSNFSFIDQVVIPVGANIPLHTHKTDNEEAYVIVSGKGSMSIGEKTVNVSAGDVIVNAPGGTHGLVNIGSDDLKIVVIEVPTKNYGLRHTLVSFDVDNNPPRSFLIAANIYYQTATKQLSEQEFQDICNKIVDDVGIDVLMWYIDIYNSRVYGGQHVGVQDWSNTAVPFRHIDIPIVFTDITDKCISINAKLLAFGSKLIDNHGTLSKRKGLKRENLVSIARNFRKMDIFTNNQIVGNRKFSCFNNCVESSIEKFFSDLTGYDIPNISYVGSMAAVFGGNFPAYVEMRYVVDNQLLAYFKLKAINSDRFEIRQLAQESTPSDFSDKLTRFLLSEQISAIGLVIQELILDFANNNQELKKFVKYERLPNLYWDEIKFLVYGILGRNLFTTEERKNISPHIYKFECLLDERELRIDSISKLIGVEKKQLEMLFMKREHLYAYHDNRRVMNVLDVVNNCYFSIGPNDSADLTHKLITRFPTPESIFFRNRAEIGMMLRFFCKKSIQDGFWLFQGALTKASSHPDLQHWHYIEIANKFGQKYEILVDQAESLRSWIWCNCIVQRINFPNKLYCITNKLIGVDINEFTKLLDNSLNKWVELTGEEFDWAAKVDADSIKIYIELRRTEATLKSLVSEMEYNSYTNIGMMGSLGLFGQSTTKEVVEVFLSDVNNENYDLSYFLGCQVENIKNNFVRSLSFFAVHEKECEIFENIFDSNFLKTNK